MANNYGGGWEPRADTERANTSPASYRTEGLKPNAPAASTLSGYVEALFAEQYAREQAADHPDPCEGFAFKYGPAHGAD